MSDAHITPKAADEAVDVGSPPAEEEAVNVNVLTPSVPIIDTSHHHSEEDQIPITSAVRTFAMCAALNSCNLGYDIGVNTGAANLVRDDLGLSDGELEIFLGSINLFGIIGAIGASWISDNYGRRKTFKVSVAVYCFCCEILTDKRIGIVVYRNYTGPRSAAAATHMS